MLISHFIELSCCFNIEKRSGEASTMETSLEHGALGSAYMQKSDLLI